MIRVTLACSGLGHVKRGFETFTRECFDALVDHPALELTLFKGAGEPRQQEMSLWNLRRSGWQAMQLGKLTGRSSYNIEQSTFFFSLLPHIYRQNPDVIYLSDLNLGHALWHWRRLTKKRYKLLLSNGMPQDPPFPRWDHVQQLTPVAYQNAVRAGIPDSEQSFVPLGFHLPAELELLYPGERKALRSQLGLPDDVPLILSVGFVDTSHKRMDYVIREVARLPEPRPYLLIVGHQDADSAAVVDLGVQLLGTSKFQVRTVEPQEVAQYYKAADLFVLASLKEGFGRAYVEAMNYGLPCLAHDYAVTQFILGKEGYLADFEQEGRLTDLILKVLSEPDDPLQRQQRHRSIYEQFSWTELRPRYIEMIQKCAA